MYMNTTLEMESNAKILKNLSLADNEKSKPDRFYRAPSNNIHDDNTDRQLEVAFNYMDNLAFG